ncbi:hypothetical protein HY380_01200 [Candidatus Saccharibacteria bacterium]|nr:hypothetical protein [Candidatus Saccharibacteria bacterium]
MSIKSAAELAAVLNKAHEELFSASSIFPFSLFPDTITIDREKVSIARRSFFRVAKIDSFQIDDTLSVSANVGPILGSVVIQTRFFNKPIRVNNLKRSDAMTIKRVLQGFHVARHNEVECSQFGKEVLVPMLYDLGMDVTD